ncbi:MAG TPA: IS110 family transposase [Candidatus Angelobacter sp.]|jgi:transposase|nr:IS110 family transposase [Candidatus Angelobacter sp.]
MLIIGCDYHPSVQQIAVLDQETGEYQELRLEHKNGEAERFYRKLAGQQVRVGVEATGGLRWFERLLGELGLELWVGDPARVRAAAARKPKTDKEDARLLLRLMEENRFPRIWVPSLEQRDTRQLVLHRHRLVQTRTRAKNQLQSLATNEGIQKRVSTQAGQAELDKAALSPWARVRRQDWSELLTELNQRIVPLDQALKQQAEQRPEVQLLMTHRGVGPVVATAFVATLCDPKRFANSKQVAAYLGLVPQESSSGKGRQRLGHITKQGNSLLRGLLVEAAHVAVRFEAEWKRKYTRLAMKKNRSIAAVAIARCLAVRLWWMWKLGLNYQQFVAQKKESRSHAE